MYVCASVSWRIHVLRVRACLQVLAGDVAATRADQMHVRAKTEKKKKNCSSGSLNKKKLKRRKNRGNQKVASPPQRRKKVLGRKKASSSASLGKSGSETGPEKKKAKKKEAHDDEQEEWPEDDQTWQGWWNEDWPADGEWPQEGWEGEEWQKPAKVMKRPAGRSAGSKAKGAPKASAKPKAKAKAKAKAKSSPEPSAKGKAKAKPKAKSSSKASAKGRPKAKAKAKIMQELQDDRHSVEEWLRADYVDVLMNYGVQALDRMDEDLPEFKAELRGTLPRFEMSRLNVYWGRPSCGVTLKATGKDMGTFTAKHDDLPHNLSLALAIQAGTSYASWLQCCM